MLVKCVKILEPFGGAQVETHPGVTIGVVYPVIEIAYLPDYWYLRILDDNGDGSSSLWDPEMFETVDGYIPRCWSSAVSSDGSLRLAPQSWMREGFWTDVLADEPSALADFDEGKAAVLADLASQ
ncbi:hypothetical protein ACFO1B_27085 [Dactylosporangium siamense]|uniref:Uncharacterized protein n=1 Tax=Dactylosporangium siamense TaxID=685454 RepID=A0A919UDI5_9ACTN|nr:hypothetical protein [Dactylosporangium siamense]GIG46678.1 hypothetical protein Dsi01nite_047190 [Dactylosporangium siamense]